LAKSVVEGQGTKCILNVDVVPSATKTEVGKVNEWRNSLQIKVAAPPTEGQANEELIRFLSEKIDIPMDAVKILRGGTSRHKVVIIDAPKDRVEKLLGLVGC